MRGKLILVASAPLALRGRKLRMRRTLACAALLAGACGGDPDAAPFSVREEVRGDTTVVVSAGDPPHFAANGVEVAWQSDDLGNPRSMARVGARIVVGDGYRVHVLDADGVHERSFGTRGDGPGEFRSIASVGGFGPDTIAVFDVGLRRVSFFSTDGQLIETRRATPAEPFVNPSNAGPPLVRHGRGVLWTATGNVTPGSPIRAAAIRHDLDADSTTVLEVWNDIVYELLGEGVLGTRELFPARAIVVVGREGRIVEGDGLDYCFRIRSVGDPEVEMWCREAPRIRLGSGIRSPDIDLLAADPQFELLRGAFDLADPGTFLPHFDRIAFGESGELWVRVYGDDDADIHPWIVSRRSDLAPPYRHWEVFDPRGRLVKRVRLPFAFDPRVMLDDQVFGFWTLETGEITIGRASLEALRPDPHAEGGLE